MLRPHPESSRLRTKLAGCLSYAGPWVGIAYRIVPYRFATRGDLLTGVGSRRFGGRWNPRGAFEATYLSPDLNTAMAEVYGRATRSGLTAAELTPRVLVAVDVQLRLVLDLTSGPLRRRLRLSADRMKNEPWQDLQALGREALTQALGRVAWELELEGLLVPSAASPSGVNLVVFPGRLGGASRVTIVEGNKLPE